MKGAAIIDKITFASIFILDRSDSVFVVGVDLARIVDDDLVTYNTISLFLLKSECQSLHQTLIHIFAEIFKHIPEDEEGVCFRSKLPYFRDCYHKLIRKAKVYAAGRSVSFRYLRANPQRAVKIAVEAMSHNERERLNGRTKNNL